MRMLRVRITTRRMMGLVALASVVTWLAVTAVRIRGDADSRWLYHAPFFAFDKYPRIDEMEHPAPFWPRYWRALLGLRWPGSYACDCRWSVPPPGGVIATYAGPAYQEGAIDKDSPRFARRREAIDEASRKAEGLAKPTDE